MIVTLLPLNSALPWITPAQFRPELVPEELMAQGLTVRNGLGIHKSHDSGTMGHAHTERTIVTGLL